MKVKVLRTFTDADNGVTLNKGDLFECSDNRANFLTCCGFAEVEAKPQRKASTKKATKKEDK